MGWERRGTSGASYLYLSRRDAAGRVVKQYLGRGPQAQEAARALARRAADRHALSQARATLAGPEASMAALHAATGALLEAALLAAGYRRHNYGPWRKRRGHGHS
jgi:hypothetical protein